VFDVTAGAGNAGRNQAASVEGVGEKSVGFLLRTTEKLARKKELGGGG